MRLLTHIENFDINEIHDTFKKSIFLYTTQYHNDTQLLYTYSYNGILQYFKVFISSGLLSHS
jgi:hypothetical protein